MKEMPRQLGVGPEHASSRAATAGLFALLLISLPACPLEKHTRRNVSYGGVRLRKPATEQIAARHMSAAWTRSGETTRFRLSTQDACSAQRERRAFPRREEEISFSRWGSAVCTEGGAWGLSIGFGLAGAGMFGFAPHNFNTGSPGAGGLLVAGGALAVLPLLYQLAFCLPAYGMKGTRQLDDPPFWKSDGDATYRCARQRMLSSRNVWVRLKGDVRSPWILNRDPSALVVHPSRWINLVSDVRNLAYEIRARNSSGNWRQAKGVIPGADLKGLRRKFLARLQRHSSDDNAHRTARPAIERLPSKNVLCPRVRVTVPNTFKGPAYAKVTSLLWHERDLASIGIRELLLRRYYHGDLPTKARRQEQGYLWFSHQERTQEITLCRSSKHEAIHLLVFQGLNASGKEFVAFAQNPALEETALYIYGDWASGSDQFERGARTLTLDGQFVDDSVDPKAGDASDYWRFRVRKAGLVTLALGTRGSPGAALIQQTWSAGSVAVSKKLQRSTPSVTQWPGWTVRRWRLFLSVGEHVFRVGTRHGAHSDYRVKASWSHVAVQGRLTGRRRGPLWEMNRGSQHGVFLGRRGEFRYRGFKLGTFEVETLEAKRSWVKVVRGLAEVAHRRAKVVAVVP